MPFIKETFYLKSPQNATMFLRKTLNLTQRDAQKFIDKGRVEQNGEIVRDKTRILCGEVHISHFKAQDLGIKPIFETHNFAVFDKPPKLLSHPKGRFFHLSLLDSIRFHCGNNANLINRLDSETSGILLVSKHKKSEIILKNLFENRVVEKRYLAVVFGKINAKYLMQKSGVKVLDSLHFIISLPIKEGKLGSDLGIRSLVCKNAKLSQSVVKIISYNDFANTTFLEICPLTGRTHQIRLHLAAIGHRIVGESLYGIDDSIARDFLDGKINEAKRAEFFGANRLLLHSQSLRFCYEDNDFFITSKMDFTP